MTLSRSLFVTGFLLAGSVIAGGTSAQQGGNSGGGDTGGGGSDTIAFFQQDHLRRQTQTGQCQGERCEFLYVRSSCDAARQRPILDRYGVVTGYRCDMPGRRR